MNDLFFEGVQGVVMLMLVYPIPHFLAGNDYFPQTL